MKIIAMCIIFISSFFALKSEAQFATGYMGMMYHKHVTIALNGTKTAAIDLKGFTVVGIQFPSAFTGTAVSFEVGPDQTGTFVPVYNSSGVISYTAAASRYLSIDPSVLMGVIHLKVVSNASEAAARTIILHLKGL